MEKIGLAQLRQEIADSARPARLKLALASLGVLAGIALTGVVVLSSASHPLAWPHFLSPPGVVAALIVVFLTLIARHVNKSDSSLPRGFTAVVWRIMVFAGLVALLAQAFPPQGFIIFLFSLFYLFAFLLSSAQKEARFGWLFLAAVVCLSFYYKYDMLKTLNNNAAANSSVFSWIIPWPLSQLLPTTPLASELGLQAGAINQELTMAALISGAAIVVFSLFIGMRAEQEIIHVRGVHIIDAMAMRWNVPLEWLLVLVDPSQLGGLDEQVACSQIAVRIRQTVEPLKKMGGNSVENVYQRVEKDIQELALLPGTKVH